MKNERAITLIALIVTIIILLILAGVTISVLFGNNGLLNKAKQGAESYKIAGIKEKVEQDILAQDIEKITKNETLTLEQALVGLYEHKIFEEIDLSEQTGICEGYVIKLGYNENGKVVILGMDKDVGVRLKIARTPKGYTNGNIEIAIGLSTDKEKITSIETTEGMTKKENGTYIIEKNGTYKVKANLTNGESLEKEIVIALIDKLPPKEFTPEVAVENDGTIQIKENAEDAEATEESVQSGIDYCEYYVINSSNEETKYDTNKIEGLATGTYKVYLITYDKAGNSTKSAKVDAKVEEWIKIYNEEDLRNIANDLTKNYILMNNIELTKTWEPIGDSDNRFKGTLDGAGYKISGLNNGDSTQDLQGLLAYIGTGGKVSNLNVEGTITGATRIGILAGSNYGGTIENVKVSGKVLVNKISSSYIGGLVGSTSDALIENCYSNVEVGLTRTSIVTVGNVGGLVGQNGPDCIIRKSASSGKVVIVSDNTCSEVGGLVGNNCGIIENTYVKGEVNGGTTCKYVGGLVGWNYGGQITNSYVLATVCGKVNTSTSDYDYYVGGLVGCNNKGGTVTNSYWNKEKAGVETSDGGTELTLEQMQTQASYKGWDFTSETVWKMKEYPELIF